jgi:UDP-GlcNAc:undecaprenyl-phosphate GlcNAc-1-phosphate transferase
LILDVNAPWLHESFHAKRRRADVKGEVNHEWWSSLPLIADGRLFGKIEIASSPESGFSHHEVLTALLEVVAAIEKQVAEIDSATAAERSARQSETSGVGSDAQTSTAASGLPLEEAVPGDEPPVHGSL